jgi:regulator of RNase E activity RraA
VSTSDYLVADDDGVVAVAEPDLEGVLRLAAEIADRERRQADRARAGESLRKQLHFADYLAHRAARPPLGFREHLRAISGAIEE